VEASFRTEIQFCGEDLDSLWTEPPHEAFTFGPGPPQLLPCSVSNVREMTKGAVLEGLVVAMVIRLMACSSERRRTREGIKDSGRKISES
jgi:hypothetical protein